MSRLALIGVGAMGEPMAANFLKRGVAVTVLKSRRPGVNDRLKVLGARLAATPLEAAEGCEVIVLSLPTSREVESALLGESGAAAKAPSGTLVIDCTTGNPPDSERIAARLRQRGIGFVAAGMTRGVAGAKQGRLAFFIGGEPADVERAKAVLAATGDTFIEFGSAAEAHMAKVIGNVLSYATVALVNEALMLGAKGGLDLPALYRALSEQAPSRALEAFGSRIVAGEFDPPRVTVDHACDDLVLARGLAARAGAPLAMLASAHELYRRASAGGEGERDLSIIAQSWRAAGRS
ncbi:MAG: NAD(P)-dependent oxidoreductase [Burkholderiales bacterium]|nr:NAD(P)-dependent oxidoreductase [Burkholderiales bacterium]